MLSRISKHLRRIDYLDLTVSGNVVRDIKFLPLGQILRENITRERNTDRVVLDENFNFNEFPMAYLTKYSSVLKRKNPLAVFDLQNFQSTQEESPEIALHSCKVLSSTSLVSSKHAFELFYQLQRQRKIWWMTWMYNPGQIMFTNPNRTENAQTISISMKTGDGFNLELERIGLYTLGGSTKQHVLQSWFSVDISVLSFLIDALPERDSDDFTLYLHRRLSPYNVVLLAEDDAIDKDLQDLSRLVNYELSNGKLNVLNRVKEVNEELNQNVTKADQMGIPYSLIMGKESLQTGLIKLRSRNTTLSEVIHISDIPEYVEKIIHG